MESYFPRIGPEYKAWWSAKDRCINPKSQMWHLYGGRGITMCERWLNSFDHFMKDMGKRPENPEHWKSKTSYYTLDRRDSNAGYSPENCYWATWSEQRYSSIDAGRQPHPPTLDITGHVFGRLTALYKMPKNDGWEQTYWMCQCSCGSEPAKVALGKLRNGKTKSCGCLHKEIMKAWNRGDKVELERLRAIGFSTSSR